MCENLISQSVLGGMAKGHELIQQLLHSAIREYGTLPLLLYTLVIAHLVCFNQLAELNTPCTMDWHGEFTSCL